VVEEYCLVVSRLSWFVLSCLNSVGNSMQSCSWCDCTGLVESCRGCFLSRYVASWEELMGCICVVGIHTSFDSRSPAYWALNVVYRES
jgi:hypothetical protein